MGKGRDQHSIGESRVLHRLKQCLAEPARQGEAPWERVTPGHGARGCGARAWASLGIPVQGWLVGSVARIRRTEQGFRRKIQWEEDDHQKKRRKESGAQSEVSGGKANGKKMTNKRKEGRERKEKGGKERKRK